MSFKDNLRKERHVAGISQEKLAEEMLVSRQTISKWENGETYPSTKHILMLAKVLECGVEPLIGGRADYERSCIVGSYERNYIAGGGERNCVANSYGSRGKRFAVWLVGAATVAVLTIFGLLGLIERQSPIDGVKVAGFDKMINGIFDEAMNAFERDGYATHEIVGYGITEDDVFYIKCNLNGIASEPCSALVYFCEDGDTYECQYLDDPEFIPKGKYYKVG